MKKYLIVLLLYFSLSLGAKAQTTVYHPFPDSNATWCCSYIFSFPPNCYYGYSSYKMSGKQFINSNWYNRILYHDSSAHWQCSPPIYFGSTVINDTFYVRQDSNLKTVWIYDTNSNTDKVLYNFNLNVGDTLDTTKVYFANGFAGTKIITSIDSVLINGTYHKRFNYNTGCTMFPTDTSMIEGIGALHGLIYPPSCFESFFFLNAFEQNNTLLYGDSTAVCYDFTTSIAENKHKTTVNIFPNPTNDKIIIENLPTEKINLRLINIFGQEIYTIQVQNTNKFSLSLNEYSSGIYFLSIQTSSEIINKKIIKQ
jgi:hypothetical protein